MTGSFEIADGVFIDKEVPVVIYKDGKRIEIGKGYVNAQGIFTTDFNDSPEAKALYDEITRDFQFSLAVSISEVAARRDTNGLPSEG